GNLSDFEGILIQRHSHAGEDKIQERLDPVQDRFKEGLLRVSFSAVQGLDQKLQSVHFGLDAILSRSRALHLTSGAVELLADPPLIGSDQSILETDLLLAQATFFAFYGR